MLAKEKRDNLIRSEIETWTTVKLNTVIHSENFVNDVIKDHVQSIYCYYDNSEVYLNSIYYKHF